MSEMSTVEGHQPEARYAYYRRCQVFRRNGEQCKAPAEKGTHICYAHAGQLATAVRRERERRAVLAEAVAEMRKRGKPECEMADLFTDFKGIQVTLAVMSRAVIKGTIDCKTAGQMLVHLQTMSKLLWMLYRKTKTSPRINTDDIYLKKMPKPKPLPRINAADADRKKPCVRENLAVTFSKHRPALAPSDRGAKVLQFDAMLFGDGSRAHGPPESKAA